MCMLRSRKKILSFVAVVLVALPGTVSASTGNLMKTYEYTTQDQAEKVSDQFSKEIRENGKTYRLKNISYHVLSEKPVITQEPVSKTVKSGKLTKDAEYSPEETIEQDGVEYFLQDTVSRDVVLKKGSSRTVSGYTEYRSKSKADTAPAQKLISATDSKTGKVYSQTCSKVATSKRTEWENTSIRIRFIGYDAGSYKWNGITVKKNDKSPLKGYEKELLNSVGVSPGQMKNYRVGKIIWAGKAYRNANGVLCRDATAAVRKKVNIYRVSYRGMKTVEDTMGVVYTSTYAGIRQTETGSVNYQIRAQAEYEPEKEVPYLFIGLTAGILIAIVLMIGILFIIKKKEKKGRR